MSKVNIRRNTDQERENTPTFTYKKATTPGTAPATTQTQTRTEWTKIVAIERFPDTNDPMHKGHKGLAFMKNDEGNYFLVADDSATNARIVIKPDDKELVNFAFQILRTQFLKI